ncbi:hypothetical protein ACJJI4_11990 [Microbulbifer sp. TRSA002]|uniref:hypothetical protein n=1 Tax=Microbulbifer sp. TRSA002 TaxID=3243382 RepID=UPI004039EC93
MLKATKVFYAISFALSLLVTVFFSVIWWKWHQMPYNETGRYWDGFVVWHEQAVGVYAGCAIVSLVVTVAMAIIYRKVGRSENT